MKTGLSRDALAPSGLPVVPLPSGLDGFPELVQHQRHGGKVANDSNETLYVSHYFTCASSRGLQVFQTPGRLPLLH